MANRQKIDKILEQIEQRTARIDSTDQATAIYLLLLALCNSIGALGRGKQVFYPANGADLFPALFGAATHTVDMRLGREQVSTAFSHLCRAVLSKETMQLAGSTPEKLDRWTRHDTESLAIDQFASRVGEFVGKSGVVVFKHALEYLLAYEEASGSLRWLDLLLEAMPSGTVVIIFEPTPYQGSSLGCGLSDYMLRSKMFEDRLKRSLCREQRRRLASINEAILRVPRSTLRLRIPRVQSAEVYFEGAGALSVLQRA